MGIMGKNMETTGKGSNSERFSQGMGAPLGAGALSALLPVLWGGISAAWVVVVFIPRASGDTAFPHCSLFNDLDT